MLSHIFLHVGLCNAVASAAPDTTVAMHVVMSYRVGGNEIDKTVKFTRGDDTQTVVELDVPRSMYLLQLDVPKYHCSTTDFVDVLSEQNRSIAETLTDGPKAPPPPVELFAGTAPLSFMYVKPTFVAFDKSVTCNGPIAQPIPTHVNVEYDQGAYYVWLYEDPTIAAGGPLTVALKLRTTTGLAHYVRLPIPFPAPWGGWPGSVQLNVTEDMIDGIATEKTDTLLCPKMWETSAS
jgi:hypothetical protein